MYTCLKVRKMTDYYAMTERETLRQLDTDMKCGLTEAEARRRIGIYGQNKLADSRHKPIILRFLLQFKDFMTIILLLAAGCSFGISLWRHDNSFLDPMIIISIIIINSILGLLQEYRAEKAIEALKKMTARTTGVLRDGIRSEIDVACLVPGDIIFLKIGDYIPADARLLSLSELKVDESALTGESKAVKKSVGILESRKAVSDRANMVFMLGTVTAGRACAVVTETGSSTEAGKIAGMIRNEELPETPLQKRLDRIGKNLGIAAVATCALIFVIGLVEGRPGSDMFLISVSLAVAIMPEGLPAIVTIMLSAGVQRMAENKAVVRRMPAVETLGTATVICSDNTDCYDNW